MSAHLFGVSERQRATSRVPRALQILGVAVPLLLCVSGLTWWNGLLDPHEVVKLAVLLVGAAALAFVQGAYFLQKSDAPRPLPLVLLLLLDVMLFSAAVTAFFAPNILLAWLGVAGSISGSASVTIVAGIACLAAASLRTAGWKPHWPWLFGVYLTVMALAFVQRLGWIDLSPGGGAARLFSPLGNEIMVAWTSVLMLVVTITVRALPWSRWVAVGIGLAWLTWLDRSEMWLVLLLSLVTGQVLYAVQKTRNEGVFWALPSRIGAVLALMLWLIPVPRTTNLPVLITASWGQSMTVVKAAWGEAFFFGVGQGQWSSMFERVRPIEANLGPLFALRFDVGTNWWLTSAAQEGVLGLAVRVLWVLALGVHVFRLAKHDEDRVIDGVLFVAAVGMLSFVHPYAWLLVTAFALLGYAAGGEHDWPSAFRRMTGGSMLFLGSIAVLLLIWQVPHVVADAAARRVLTAETVEQRVAALETATRWARWIPDYALALTQARTQLIVSQLQNTSTQNEVLQESLARGIEQAKSGTDHWPTSADMWMARGGLYLAIAPATQGADQFAIQSYQEGMKYAPKHPGFPLGIASVYIRRAEAAAPTGASASTTKALADYRLEQRRLAAQWLQRALEMKPDDQGILYAYATNLVRAGDVSSALPLFKALVERQPERVDLGLEYATILALAKQYNAAIPFAQRVSSTDPLYTTARHLLTDWYVANNDWVNALSAWKSLPASEQTSTAFRTRLRELQSKVGTTGSR